MSAKVGVHPHITQHSILHRDFIRLLIMEELSKFQRDWNHFLLFSYFEIKESKSYETQTNNFLEKPKTAKTAAGSKKSDSTIQMKQLAKI